MKVMTSSEKVNRAMEIADEDIRLNIRKFKSGLLEEERPVLLAGGDYDRPWTRDASINVYNYLALYDREVARNTLLSVLRKTEKGIYIGGQYWDCVIWALGAERYIDIHKDDEFSRIAVEAVSNTLSLMEKEEFSEDYGLFRGAAVYGDGVSAYPDVYGISGRSGCILDWPAENIGRKAETGYGIPMHVLSTNCAYYNAYMMVHRSTGSRIYYEKASKLKRSILNNFWCEGRLGYIKGPLGDYYEQEGLGLAFGSMFGILPAEALEAASHTAHGIACVDITYGRYDTGSDLGRHSGTIWSFINSFYANAALKHGKKDVFENEFNLLTEKALRDGQFYEIYHPVTGKPYGGIQEPVKNNEYSRLKSCEHQVWSATGYMSMVINGIAGFTPGEKEPIFCMNRTSVVDFLEIEGLIYKGAKIDIRLKMEHK